MEPVRYLAKPALFKAFPATGHVIVEASAGTGKTYTIERLVVDLLLGEPALKLDEILVVTFTEMATAELRSRIRGMLESLLTAGEPRPPAGGAPYWTLGAAARRRIENALFAFDAAPIHTIHSFCRRVLSENSFHNRQLFNLELADGREAFHRAFRDSLRITLAVDSGLRSLLHGYLQSNETVEKLEELLYTCRRERARFVPAWNEEAFFAWADGAAQRFDPVGFQSELAEAHVHKQWQGKAMGVAAALAEPLAAWATGRDPVSLLAALSRIDPGYLLRPRAGAKATAGKGLRAYPEGLSKTHRDFLAGLAQWPALRVSARSVVVQALLPAVGERLERLKREEGFHDYDDMLNWVKEGLEGDGGDELAAALRRRYKAALIDEFQDTDPVQWAIFNRLFVEAPAGGGHRLVVVGDPKQAIYGFRGADFQTYLSARETLEKTGACVLSLEENQRSTGALIEAVNAVLDQAAPEPVFNGESVRYDHPARCGRPDREAVDAKGRPAVPLRLVAVDAADHAAPAVRALLARAMVAEIGRLIRAPSERVSDRENPDLRGLLPGNIYVLTHSSRDGLEFAGHLREAGIRHSFYKQDGLFETAEAFAVHDLLAAVADPSDRSKRMKAWGTPFFSIGWNGLAPFRDADETHPCYHRLLSWKRLAADGHWGIFFDTVLQESGVLRRSLFHGEGEREITNYRHLFDLLLEEAQRHHPAPNALARWLQGFVDGTSRPSGEDGGVQRLESDRSSVKILTIHKSKGLEAQAVFVYGGLHRATYRDLTLFHNDRHERCLIFADDLKGFDGAAAVEAERREEEQRLLYVALTRAQSLLYLPLIKNPRRALTGIYAQLNARLVAMQPLDLAGKAEIVPAGLTLPQVPVKSRMSPGDLAGWNPPAALLADPVDPLPRMAACRAAAAPLSVVSYTSLRGAHGPFLSPGDNELPGGSEVGQCLHEILEALFRDFPSGSIGVTQDRDAWAARKDIGDVHERAMRRHGLAGRHLPKLQGLVYGALTRSIEVSGGGVIPGLHTCRTATELEFMFSLAPAAGAETGFAKGFIDLVFEHGGRIYFADWKSDTLRTYDSGAMAERVNDFYRWQEILYTLGVVKLLGAGDEKQYNERFGGYVYVFLRGLERPGWGMHFSRPSWGEWIGFESKLGERVERLRT